MKKLISILGSTGSVGKSTLSIIDDKKNIFKPHIFSANKNFNLINNQIKKYKPSTFIIINEKIFEKIKKKYKNKKIKILNSFDEISLQKKSDITISAIPGIAGLKPTIKFIKLTKKLLLANKESIICGWDIINKKSKKNKTEIIPLDSEHYSISRLLHNHKLDTINKVYLTASGGPFLNYKLKQLKRVKLKDTLKHPKWVMGKKITIDSSTLMNKILEFIEAQKLFNLSRNKLDIVIHPESLVHAIIDFKNGLKHFIYHETSMKIPIANAIFDGKLDIKKFFIKKNKKEFENLTFKKVNKKIFPSIKLIDKINDYPSTPIIINAANEILVDQFIKEKIPFLSINKIIMSILKDRNYKKYAIRKPININQIIKVDSWARYETMRMIKSLYA